MPVVKEMIRLNTSLFVVSPDEELLCGICMNVLYLPVETPCRHVFCTDCIHHSLREQNKCPLCREECTKSSLKKVLPLVQNLLNKLIMKCKNYDNGCIAPIKMEYYPNHLPKCDYAMIKCKNQKCSVVMLRKNLREHELSTCLFRSILCERGCGLMLEKSKVKTHDCVAALVSLVKDLKEEKASMQKDVDDLKIKLTVLQNEMTAAQPEFDESEVSSVASSPFWITTSDSSDSDSVSTANSEHFSSFSYQDDSDGEHAVDAVPGSPSSVAARSDISGTEHILYQFPMSDSLNLPNTIVLNEDSPLYNGSILTTGPNKDLTSSPLPAVGNKRAHMYRRRIKITKRLRPRSWVDPKEGSSGNGSGNKMSSNTPVATINRSHKPLLFVKDNDEGLSTSSLAAGKKQCPFRRQKSMDTAAGLYGIGKSNGPGKGMGRSLSAIVDDSHDNETHSDDVTSTLEDPRLSERPLTRSLARRCNRRVAQDVIPNVKVPPTAAYLLDKYTFEDSSDDEMWLPPDSFKWT